jgi:hypothetical protein
MLGSSANLNSRQVNSSAVHFIGDLILSSKDAGNNQWYLELAIHSSSLHLPVHCNQMLNLSMKRQQVNEVQDKV